MNNIDWKRKLTSRKFWMALAGFVVGLLNYLKMDSSQTEKIGDLILMGGSVIAYIIGEGLADAARAKPAKPADVHIEEADEEEE